MHLLLDESLPQRLARHLRAEGVDTVHDRHWSGFKNGELLRAAETEYDVLVTADQNPQHQQNLRGFAIGVVVLAARTNRIEDLLPLVPDLERACASVGHGEVVRVKAKAASEEE